MTEITKYQAFDGKMFDEEDDCYDYECRLLCQDGIKLFDYRYNPIFELENAYYIIIENDKGLESLKSLIKIQCIQFEDWLDVITEPGEYFWEDNDSKWFTLESYINYCKANDCFTKARDFFNLLNGKGEQNDRNYKKRSEDEE